jgi:hypothetical protein
LIIGKMGNEQSHMELGDVRDPQDSSTGEKQLTYEV